MSLLVVLLKGKVVGTYQITPIKQKREHSQHTYTASNFKLSKSDGSDLVESTTLITISIKYVFWL